MMTFFNTVCFTMSAKSLQTPEPPKPEEEQDAEHCHEEITLTVEDEEILDRVWDEIGKENAKKWS